MLKFAMFVFLFCIAGIHSDAQQLLQKPYKPSFSEGKIRAYLKDIEKKTGVEISFSELALNSKKKVKISGSEHTIEQVLRTLLSGLPVKWVERTDRILIIPVVQEQSPSEIIEKITLSGFIKDSISGEVLIGAAVFIPALGAGTFTNSYGFYSLTLPGGQYEMTVSYIGYKKKILTTSIARKDILLCYDDELSEVNVVEKRDKPSDHIQLNTADMNKYPALLGDNDVMRSLQHKAGVQPGPDGTVGLIVRGGDPSQNLCLLDGVPLYYTDHLVGISSTYNTEALKTADFYSGSFPSRYGGRLSSVLDIYTKDGDMEHFGGSAKIGLLSGNISLEGPLIKNKASMIISARRSWADLVMKIIDTTNISGDFYDINAKINYQINSSNRVYLSVYKGRDKLRLGDGSDAEEFNILGKWGNAFIAAKWNTVLTPKIFLNTTLTYSNFRYQLDMPDFISGPDSAGGFATLKGISTIKERTIRSQLYWYLSAKHKLEMGLHYSNATFDPATASYEENGIFTNNLTPAERFNTNEAVLYAEEEWKPGTKFKVRLGLHVAHWFNRSFSYPTLQPRLYLSYKPATALTLYGSASRMAQFLHMLNNGSFGIPTDFWLPSTKIIKPESSLLANAGFKLQLSDDFTFSIELYYKKLQNLIGYRGSNSFYNNTENWESVLTQGSRRSYGLECSIEKQLGKVFLAVVYTLSKSERQFDELFNGATFPYKYDRRHNLHLDGTLQVTKGINISASWVFMTGNSITLPDDVYPDFDNNLLNNQYHFGPTYNYAALNNFQLPPIHRLDIAVNFTKKKRQRYERTITLGIFNAYGRRNILGTYLSQDDTGAYSLEAISVGRFVPTISYRIQF